MSHVMIDLETLDLSSTAVIVSIGAVIFDIDNGECYREFYNTISIDSCTSHGLSVGGSTLNWWLSKSYESKIFVFSGKETLEAVLTKFNAFLWEPYVENADQTIYPWGNSSRFDLGILANAYKAIGMEKPWNDKNERDVRTLVSFAPEVKNECPFEGTEHNPVDDCKHQIKYCSKI